MVRNMIVIENLNKFYEDNHVLKDINLEIPRGSIFGILGKSGSGKSTLLKCINGLENINSGSIKIDGIEISNQSKEQMRQLRKNMGMIFQQFSLVDRITVKENVALPLEVWHYDKETIKSRVEELLDIVGLLDKKDAKARDLSGGQMQRVAIARALTTDPEILLSDESTSSLDPRSTNSIVDLLKDINKKTNKTELIVTHEMDVVKSLCDYVAVIENGYIQAVGKTEDIFFNQPKSLVNLIGSNDNLVLPKKGTTIHIKYFNKPENQTLIADMARKIDENFIIVDFYKDNLKNAQINNIFINVEDNNYAVFSNYLDSNNISNNRI